MTCLHFQADLKAQIKAKPAATLTKVDKGLIESTDLVSNRELSGSEGAEVGTLT